MRAQAARPKRKKRPAIFDRRAPHASKLAVAAASAAGGSRAALAASALRSYSVGQVVAAPLAEHGRHQLYIFGCGFSSAGRGSGSARPSRTL